MGTAACGYRDKVEKGVCGHRQRWRLVWEAERWGAGEGVWESLLFCIPSFWVSSEFSHCICVLLWYKTFKNASRPITLSFYNKPTTLETDRNSTDIENLLTAKHHPRPQTQDSGAWHYTQAWCTRTVPGSWGKAAMTPAFRTPALWHRPRNTLPHWRGYSWGPGRFSPR